MNRVLDKIQNVVEYLITLPFLLSAVALPFAAPLGTKGFIVLIFGGHIALYIYSVWFFFISLGLIYTKIKKKRKAHRNFLMAIYLTCIYTSVLTFYLVGWTGIIDDVFIGIVTAICWIRWKFRFEYIQLPQPHSEVTHIHDDPPPLP